MAARQWLAPKNASRREMKAGQEVVLKALPQGFTDDLPPEDQNAIWAVIGQPIRLNGYDADGRAELEFRDDQGIIHFIYVDPKFLSTSGQ